MMAENSKRVWFITGSSSGFGRLLAEQALEAGERVAATARNSASVADLEKKYPGRAKAIQLDVTEKTQAERAVAEAIAHFGRIDVLVNNAGYGLIAAQEEATDDEIRREIDTNIYGVIHVTQAVLPHLRRQKSGHIINMSSIAGLVGETGLGYYNLTKFALEGISEALGLELAPLGIHVTAIEPGPFRTEFAGRSLAVSANQIEDYASTAGKVRTIMRARNHTQKGDPLRAVLAIRKVVESTNPPRHLLLGAFAWTKFHDKIERFQKEMSEWKSVTLGADFPEDELHRSAR